MGSHRIGFARLVAVHAARRNPAARFLGLVLGLGSWACRFFALPPDFNGGPEVFLLYCGDAKS
jgi:hypothetical protein